MKKILCLLLALLLLFTGCDMLPGSSKDDQSNGGNQNGDAAQSAVSLDDIPAYSGDAYIYVNDGVPSFSAEELSLTSYERYGDLDSLGRCTECIAVVGVDIMPTEDRGSISSVKPTGWQSAQYDIVDGKHLYNRCHLIGFQLTGENANAKNLITGTRYLNIEGMLPFENMIADYVKETENHVAFRVVPIFNQSNMVADGVFMEAKSIEDDGEGISFAVFCYNVQPGIVINYADGTSALSGEPLPEEQPTETGDVLYVLNTRSKRIHLPTCSSVTDMAEYNKKETYETISSLTAKGYTPCGSCKPQ